MLYFNEEKKNFNLDFPCTIDFGKKGTKNKI